MIATKTAVAAAPIRLARVLGRTTCGLLLVVSAGFFFFLALFNDYLSLNGPRDSFYSDAAFILSFVTLFVVALVKLVAVLARREWSSKFLAYGLSLTTCLLVSFFAQAKLYLWADQLFLYANSERFAAMIANARELPLLVHIRSSRNFYKAIVYDRRHVTTDDPIIASDLKTITDQLLPVEACKLASDPLGRGFYVIRVYC